MLRDPPVASATFPASCSFMAVGSAAGSRRAPVVRCSRSLPAPGAVGCSTMPRGVPLSGGRAGDPRHGDPIELVAGHATGRLGEVAGAVIRGAEVLLQHESAPG